MRARTAVRLARRYGRPPTPIVLDGVILPGQTPGSFFTATTVVPAPTNPSVSVGQSYKSAFGHRVFCLAEGVVASPYNPALNRDNTRVLFDGSGVAKVADLTWAATTVLVTNIRNAFSTLSGLPSDCIWGNAAVDAARLFYLETPGAAGGAKLSSRVVSTPTADNGVKDFLTDPTFTALFGNGSGSSGGGGIPFGAWNAPVAKIPPLWTATLLDLGTSGSTGLRSIVDACAAIGAKIIIDLWPRTGVVNADGTFNLDLWKAAIRRFFDAGLADYIAQRVADRTIIASHIMDEPYDTTSWGGQAISNATVDEMARYHKSLFPTCLTTVRASADHLTGFSWAYLDLCWNQYLSGRGGTSPAQGNATDQRADVTAYRDSKVALAQTVGLRTIMGLNWTDGGDGSSGIPGGIAGRFFMSAQELTIYGEVLGTTPECEALFGWRYNPAHDSIYFNLQSIRDAMIVVRDFCANRVAPSPARSLSSLRSDSTRTRFCALVLDHGTKVVDGVVAYDRTLNRTWAFKAASNLPAGQAVTSVELDALGLILKLNYTSGYETIRLSDSQRSNYVADSAAPIDDAPGSNKLFDADGIAVYRWDPLHPATAGTRQTLYSFARR